MERERAAPVLLINVFEVPAGTEQDFVAWWEKSSTFLAKEPGFVDAQLHRSVQSGTPFRFINIAHWETVEALDRARAKHGAVLQALSEGKGHPALYEVISQYEGVSKTKNGE